MLFFVTVTALSDVVPVETTGWGMKHRGNRYLWVSTRCPVGTHPNVLYSREISLSISWT